MESHHKPRLPYWPAALDHKMAAAYCGLSESIFTAICPVQPIQFPGRSIEHRYLRHRLDAWLSEIEANKASVEVASMQDVGGRVGMWPMPVSIQKAPRGIHETPDDCQLIASEPLLINDNTGDELVRK